MTRLPLYTHIHVIFGMTMKSFIIIYILTHYDFKFCAQLMADLRPIDIKLEVLLHDAPRSKSNKHRGYAHISRA